MILRFVMLPVGVSVVAPTKATYSVGDKLDLTGLSANLIMSDGTIVPVTMIEFENKGLELSMANGTELKESDIGEKSITITHTATGRYASFKITINPVGTYSVTYNSNGATSGIAPTDSNAYVKDASVTVLGNTGSLAKTGSEFVGWNTQADGKGTHYEVDASFTITANVILYAEWVQESEFFSVTYDDNGATSGTAPEDKTEYEKDAEVTVLENTGNLVNTGFEFVGWNTQANGEGTHYEVGVSFTITANVILYAEWVQEGEFFSVAYDDNGATSGTTPEDKTEYKKYDEVTVLGNAGNLVKEGYTFTDWNTKVDGSGDPYADGDTFNISENVTLYAQWEPIIPVQTYEVGFNTDSASDNGVEATAVADKTEYEENETVTITVSLSGTATKSGTHTFRVSSVILDADAPETKTLVVAAGQTIFDDQIFTFDMPAENVDDLIVTNSFEADSSMVNVNAITAVELNKISIELDTDLSDVDIVITDNSGNIVAILEPVYDSLTKTYTITFADAIELKHGEEYTISLEKDGYTFTGETVLEADITEFVIAWKDPWFSPIAKDADTYNPPYQLMQLDYIRKVALTSSRMIITYHSADEGDVIIWNEDGMATVNPDAFFQWSYRDIREVMKLYQGKYPDGQPDVLGQTERSNDYQLKAGSEVTFMIEVEYKGQQLSIEQPYTITQQDEDISTFIAQGDVAPATFVLTPAFSDEANAGYAKITATLTTATEKIFVSVDEYPSAPNLDKNVAFAPVALYEEFENSSGSNSFADYLIREPGTYAVVHTDTDKEPIAVGTIAITKGHIAAELTVTNASNSGVTGYAHDNSSYASKPISTNATESIKIAADKNIISFYTGSSTNTTPPTTGLIQTHKIVLDDYMQTLSINNEWVPATLGSLTVTLTPDSKEVVALPVMNETVKLALSDSNGITSIVAGIKLADLEYDWVDAASNELNSYVNNGKYVVAVEVNSIGTVLSAGVSAAIDEKPDTIGDITVSFEGSKVAISGYTDLSKVKYLVAVSRTAYDEYTASTAVKIDSNNPLGTAWASWTAYNADTDLNIFDNKDKFIVFMEADSSDDYIINKGISPKVAISIENAATYTAEQYDGNTILINKATTARSIITKEANFELFDTIVEVLSKFAAADHSKIEFTTASSNGATSPPATIKLSENAKLTGSLTIPEGVIFEVESTKVLTVGTGNVLDVADGATLKSGDNAIICEADSTVKVAAGAKYVQGTSDFIGDTADDIINLEDGAIEVSGGPGYSFVLDGNATVNTSKVVGLLEGHELTVKENATLTVGGTINILGTLTVEKDGELDIKQGGFVIPSGQGKIVVEANGIVSDETNNYQGFNNTAIAAKTTVMAEAGGIKYELIMPASTPVTVSLSENLTVAQKDTLVIGTGVTVKIPDGITLTNNGSAIINGIIIIENNGKVAVATSVEIKLQNGKVTVESGGTLQIEDESIINIDAGQNGSSYNDSRIELKVGAKLGNAVNEGINNVVALGTKAQKGSSSGATQATATADGLIIQQGSDAVTNNTLILPAGKYKPSGDPTKNPNEIYFTVDAS